MNTFFAEDLTRQHVADLRDEASRLRTLRRPRRSPDQRWYRRPR